MNIKRFTFNSKNYDYTNKLSSFVVEQYSSQYWTNIRFSPVPSCRFIWKQCKQTFPWSEMIQYFKQTRNTFLKTLFKYYPLEPKIQNAAYMSQMVFMNTRILHLKTNQLATCFTLYFAVFNFVVWQTRPKKGVQKAPSYWSIWIMNISYLCHCEQNYQMNLFLLCNGSTFHLAWLTLLLGG